MNDSSSNRVRTAIRINIFIKFASIIHCHYTTWLYGDCMDSTQLKIQFEDRILPLLTPDEVFEKANHLLLERLSEDKRFEKKPTTLREELMGEYEPRWRVATCWL